jgi:hypothetical protein
VTGPFVRGVHCFVLDTQVFGDVPHPGLLLEWAQRDGIWHGLVISAQQFPRDAGWQVRQRWVAADKIRRVEGGSE